jgi:demethylmenaquinone methyltransferase/2-methoxy-6-polyprenyl-1,4-benzoquinol methylase
MEKAYVRSLFDKIAFRYDLLNHLLSGGIDLYWRRAAISLLSSKHPKKILDVATGTADFAIAALRLHPEKVVGVDISEQMLAIGRKKIQERNCSDIIRLENGEAERLNFSDNEFDAAMVAFGARNFEDLQQGLNEMYRVIGKNGTIVVLEFSRPRSFVFTQLYYLYFKHLLPLVGRIISRDTEAYRYLPDTVMKFPEGDEFLAFLHRSGFSSLREHRLTFGIATIYTGVK